MPNEETLIDTKEKYRNHHIRITVTATPPRQHDDDAGTVVARVRVYDGVPGGMGLFNIGGRYSGDIVESWDERVQQFNAEDAIADLLKQATDYVDTRVDHRDGVRESVKAAIERELTGETDGSDDE